MKFKIFNYLKENKFLNIKDPQILGQFDVIEEDVISVEDLISKKYDIIEIEGSQYEEFVNFIPAIDWNTNILASADCIILKDNVYKPYNILAEALLRILKKNVGRVNSQLPVIVVGEVHFVYGVVAKLAVSGFIEIVVSLVNADLKAALEFERKIKGYVFNLNLKILPIGDLTATDQAAFLLISNFKKNKNKEAYALLSYFNFLSEGAIFIDCNSINDSFLVEDARKAEIFVIDELEILETKYNYLVDLLKISPKV